MTFKSLVVGLLLASFAVAQVDTSPLDSCGASCLTQAISQIPCAATDSNCICSHQFDNLPDLISNCMLGKGCGVDQITGAGDQVGQFCFGSSATGSPGSATSSTVGDSVPSASSSVISTPGSTGTTLGSATTQSTSTSTSQPTKNLSNSQSTTCKTTVQIAIPLILVGVIRSFLP